MLMYFNLNLIMTGVIIIGPMSHRSRRGNLLKSSATATGSNFVPKNKIDPVQIAFVQELKRFIGKTEYL